MASRAIRYKTNCGKGAYYVGILYEFLFGSLDFSYDIYSDDTLLSTNITDNMCLLNVPCLAKHVLNPFGS